MKDYSERKEPTITFLGEREGKPERELKSALRRRFTDMRTVERAYLARVRYGNAGPGEVALALVVSAGDQAAVVGAVNEVFHAQFNTSQHLDIIFLTPTLERNLSSVCPPFYPPVLLDGGVPSYGPPEAQKP